jgi:hypothetical protein
MLRVRLAVMTFNRVLTAAERRRRRRILAKSLEPCLSSPRLVALFLEITVLVVTKPPMLAMLESLVQGLLARRQERALLEATVTPQRKRHRLAASDRILETRSER